MKLVQIQKRWFIEDITWAITKKQEMGILSACLLICFIGAVLLLQALDPTAGILDIGILSVLFFAVLAAFLLIYCCFWLQEFLWKPFKYFREDFNYHFNQLTSWQQCIIYFSVFFLWLSFLLAVLAIIL
ncbi:hypothetical protein [Sphingobacterium paramultivorum]|uniref:hypothetical protein n=1 Tax=Sphingobacterium paramultivorum TaxID=2886510 RepID=UPI00129C445D|nr:hypothetical protein [Sphingobacterium paramultivorum]